MLKFLWDPMEASSFGVAVDSQTARGLLEKIADVLQFKNDTSKFIGSHPVSLTHANARTLITDDFLVCEKTDGIRAMLLVSGGVLYLYDRKNVLYRTRYVMNTKKMFLLDGELYREGEAFLFAAFDILIYEDEDQTHLGLLARLERAYAFTRSIEKNPALLLVSSDSSHSKFRIITKQMAKSYGFYEILDGIPNLAHENDGLIFTPVADRYMLNARSRTLKWKPPHLNTVDFVIMKSIFPYTYDLYGAIAENQQRPARRTGEGGECLRKFATYYAGADQTEVDGKVGEFRYNSEKEVVNMDDYSASRGGWELYKIRTDKNTPNNIKVILDVMDSIKNNISEDQLRGLWKEMHRSYKERHRQV